MIPAQISAAEAAARGALQRYVTALREGLPADVMAVLLTGSLATGSYLPGRDIDQVTILRDDAPAGVEQAAAAALSASLAGDYVVHVAPIIYRRGQLERPWCTEWDLRAESRHLVTVPEELLRLHDHGQTIFGRLDIAALPLPTREEILAYQQRWQEWNRRYQSIHPEYTAVVEDPSVRVAVQILLSNATWHYYYATGHTCFNKHAVGERLRAEVPGYRHLKAVALATAIRRAGFEGTPEEHDALKQSVADLRAWGRAHAIGDVPRGEDADRSSADGLANQIAAHVSTEGVDT